jgi:hypothetical protein
MLTLTATIAWANDGSGGLDLGDTQTPSTDKIVDFDRDQSVRFREESDETSHMQGDAPDHSGSSQTGSGLADPNHDPGHVPGPPDVQKPGDLNGDDITNVDDLLVVVNAMGITCKESDGKELLADIAPEGGDCTVDLDDLLVVLMNWGS